MTNFEFNKSDYQLITAFFGISILWLIFRYDVENYTTFEIITGLIGYVIKTVSLICLITYLIKRYMVDNRNYVLFFLLTFFVLGFIGFLDLLRDYYTSDPAWKWDSRLAVILVNSFYNSTPDVALPLGLLLGKKYYENKLDYVKLKNTQKEMELKVLRSQYDPHFLYNSLNTIDALVDYSSKKKVKEYISNLAALYRYLIHTKDEDIVALEDEIALAENYFYLIKTRFEDDYNFEIIEEESPSLNHLPNGSLLTLLENIVKHNKAINEKRVDIKIYIKKKFLLVINTKSVNGKKEESLGTGLKNLNQRYRLLSNHKIKIEESEDNFKVQLPLLKIVV